MGNFGKRTGINSVETAIMTIPSGPIRRIGPELFENQLREEEIELLSLLPSLVEEAIEMNSPYVARMFPPTYPFDAVAQSKFEKTTGDSLVEKHKVMLEGFTSSLHNKQLNFADLAIWVGAINDIRLLLGTTLDVYEGMEPPDPSDPTYHNFVIYDYLAWLQGSILDFLGSQFSDD